MFAPKTGGSRSRLAVPVQTIDDHVALAVVTALPSTRKLSNHDVIRPSNRNLAMRYTCRSASRYSSSGEASILA